MRSPPHYTTSSSLPPPFLAKENIFANNRRNHFLHFLWRKSAPFSLFLMRKVLFCLSLQNFNLTSFHAVTAIMEIAEEVIRMNRMLEVEDLAFRIQLQEAVSWFDCSTLILIAVVHNPLCN